MTVTICISVFPELQEKLKALHELGYKIYLVGGSVRDFLLKRKISDWDFVIFPPEKSSEKLSELPESLELLVRKMANDLGASFVLLDEEFLHYRIVYREISNVNNTWQADFAAPRGKNIIQDLSERDFTINAIAYDLFDSKKTLIDPLDGLKDISKKSLNAVCDKALSEDPLRCLRAYRIAAELDFEITANTRLLIKKEAENISSISPERISFELWKLLKSPNAFKYLKYMSDDGLLESIIPEMKDLRRVPVNTHHHLPLFEHTLELVRQYELSVKNYLNINTEDEALLKMACLLHDIGKPETWEIQKDNKNERNETGEKHTFYKHDEVGAEKVKLIGKRLRWSSSEISDIYKLVLYHLRPFQVAATGQVPSDKAVNRLIRKIEDKFILLIALAWADLLSTRGEKITEKYIMQSEARLRLLCDKYKIFLHKEKTEVRLLRGKALEDLIKEAGLAPTKKIRELLEELRELQFSGIITEEEAAKKWFLEQARAK